MEKAILVGLRLPGISRHEAQESLRELARLVETAGAVAVETIIQQRQEIDPAYFIGAGKAAALAEHAGREGIRTIVFDEELHPVQQKNLEELTRTKIIDRTRLILDIFAKRARSREGILQVERAQLAYYLPRLSNQGAALDNQVGGIGTRRGPGEKALEIGRRRVREQISSLDRAIENIRRHRNVQRQKRTEAAFPLVALAGYTNAGKSTLLNALTHRNDVYADDKLFATLDPTVRQVRLPGGRYALFADTVGFINKLPHQVVAAFRSTLEEIKRAKVIVHVIDISHPNHEQQAGTALEVLKELGAGDIPVITAYNKADTLSAAQRKKLTNEEGLVISARTGQGLDKLLARIESVATPGLIAHRIKIPYTGNSVISKIHQLAVVKKRRYGADAIHLEIGSTPEQWKKIQHLVKQLRPY